MSDSRTISQVCVYAASSPKVPAVYFEAARTVGRIMAENNIRIVYGGGAKGLMGALADSALDHKGTVIGIIPEFMKAVEWDHPNATEMRLVPDMHTRKKSFFEGTNALITLPGGCGTLEELMEAITWKRLGLLTIPIIIVNVDGYYDPLLEMLNRCVEQQFMRKEHLDIWTVVERAEDVLDAIRNAPGWSEDAIGFAAV